MKKFVFQMDSLYKVKKSLKDKLQTEYAEAEAAHGSAVKKKERIEKMLMEESDKFETRAKKGMTVSEIMANNVFFEDMQKQQKKAVSDVEKAKLNADRKQQELLGIFKEIKTLEKLREKQYEEYLDEEEKKETNRIDDLLSFNISAGSVNVGDAV